MANNRKPGALGLSIPDINPSTASKKVLTVDEITKWRADLPTADVGTASKKLFIIQSELNNSILPAADRFAITELLRPTTKTICTALKKYYIEQPEPLTEQKLTIANLRQTLISEMADSYKLVFEEMYGKQDKSDEEKRILITAICRIYYYFNALLLCRYQIYSSVAENFWSEVYSLYKFALKNKILNETVTCEISFNHSISILSSFTRIMLLTATDPYQWRQKDQYSINKALDLWAVYPTIYENAQIPEKKGGIYIIDLDKDMAPIAYNYRKEPPTATCIALDVTKNIKHLKHLIAQMQNNELKARIDHPGDAEFTVTIATLNKLVKIWSQMISRDKQRFRITAKIKAAFGFNAAYYYINNLKEFDPHPAHLDLATPSKAPGVTHRPASDLPIFEIEEEADSDAKEKENQELKISEANKNKELSYRIYDYNINNISPNGFCIRLENNIFPPFQNEEIIIFKNQAEADKATWSIGAVRWIKSPGKGIFEMGIELVAPYAKAAGVQMIRDDQPVGLLIRCLILPEEPASASQAILITPSLPLHSNKVVLYLDKEPGMRTTLVSELDATSSYHKYIYSTKESIHIPEPNPEELTKNHANNNAAPSTTPHNDDKTNTEFDAIWKDL